MSTPDRGGRVLVGYFSRFGSTREIAHRMQSRLRAAGCATDVAPLDQVVDISAYRCFVIGCGVYNQAWDESATAFVTRHANTLARHDVWLFSVASFGDRHRLFRRTLRRPPRGLEPAISAMHPRGYRVFAGVIDTTLWPRRGRLLFRLVGGRHGDNRDWAAIDAWTEGIARELRQRWRAARQDVTPPLRRTVSTTEPPTETPRRRDGPPSSEQIHRQSQPLQGRSRRQ